MIIVYNDNVLCPGCGHQFRAIPVNVQKDISSLTKERDVLQVAADAQSAKRAELQRELDGLRKVVKAAAALDGEEIVFEGTRRYAVTIELLDDLRAEVARVEGQR